MYYNKNQDQITWESIGDELLFRKNKFEFTNEERILVKKLLFKYTHKLEYRRKVRHLFINNIVMANKLWSCSKNV